ncbi:hypothetical protein ACROYT_G032959 [Oculina patagonica]
MNVHGVSGSQSITEPSSGGKQKNEDDSSSSPLAICAQNYDAPQEQVRHGTLRNQQTTSSEENSQSGGLYAALNIPDGHNIYGPRDGQEEMPQNYGFSSVEQPVYNVLEDLSVRDSEETVHYGPYEPEPVYNVLEEPYAEGSERPAWYGSVPVDGPVYNTLEELNQYTGSPGTNEPVYNVLEAPDHGGTGEADSYGPSGGQDPVYNVLEGPDPDKSSGDGLYSNSLEAQDPSG